MKRFSVYKWLDEALKLGCTDEQVLMWLTWAERVHGMSAEEMSENDLVFCDEWMEEVE